MRLLYLACTLCALISQVICEAQNNHLIEKRHVSVLARLGELPYTQGKRYVAALAKNGELTSYLRPAWSKKYQESMEEELEDEEDMEKRYVGSLARGGDLRFRGSEEKRNGVEGLIRGLATGEELKRLRLEALKEELYRERQEEAQSYLDPDDKRGYGYSSESEEEDQADESAEKRGGISSLLRNGYSFPKRTMDDELEQLMTEVYGIEDKRSVASLARGFNFPMALNGKRDDAKRNLPSLLRDRAYPLGEGKRHIGAFIRTYGIPYNDKRNVVSLAKNRDFPYIYMPGKRDWSEESEEGDLSKRYVAALLRQGRLPVGEETHHIDSEDGKDSPLRQEDSKEEDQTERKKKSVLSPSPSGPRNKRDADFYGAFGPVQDKTADDWSSPINKKYLGVRGGGKIPGGRLPTLGSGRRGGRNDSNGRRRGQH